MIKNITTKNISAKAALVVAVLLAVAFVWFTVRWQIGSMFADLTRPNEPGAEIVAETAIGMAPLNARGYWLAGNIKRGFFDQQSIDASINYFRQATIAAPYSYRSWTELGRAFEQAERYDEAEKAFARAIELAPEFAIPRWQLGNFYLRRGRVDDAARELRVAAEYDSPYREQVFAIAWNVLGNDPRVVEQFAADKPDVYAALATFYGNRNLPEEALRAWNRVPEPDAQKFKWRVEAVTRSLFDKRSFIGALEFARLAGIEPTARLETVTNGDFETGFRDIQSKPMFDWSIYRLDPKIEVSRDSSAKRGGKNSVRFTVRGYGKQDFQSLQQFVATPPGGRYRLTFAVRTENLRSGSMPLLEVVNANGSLSAVSPPFLGGTNDWQEVSLDVTVPADSQGVLIRTAREPCAGDCPMNGIFWLDDVQLTRL